MHGWKLKHVSETQDKMAVCMHGSLEQMSCTPHKTREQCNHGILQEHYELCKSLLCIISSDVVSVVQYRPQATSKWNAFASAANAFASQEGMVFALEESALFCILKAFPFVIFTLGLRRKRYLSVRRPCTTYCEELQRAPYNTVLSRPTDLRRADHRVLTVDWLVG